MAVNVVNVTTVNHCGGLQQSITIDVAVDKFNTTVVDCHGSHSPAVIVTLVTIFQILQTLRTLNIVTSVHGLELKPNYLIAYTYVLGLISDHPTF